MVGVLLRYLHQRGFCGGALVLTAFRAQEAEVWGRWLSVAGEVEEVLAAASALEVVQLAAGAAAVAGEGAGPPEG